MTIALYVYMYINLYMRISLRKITFSGCDSWHFSY